MGSLTDHEEPSGLLLAYVDESYSTDRSYLGAVLVDGAAVHRIEAGLDSLVAHYGGRFGLPPTTELHGYPIFQGSGAWRGVPPRARIGAYAARAGNEGDLNRSTHHPVA